MHVQLLDIKWDKSSRSNLDLAPFFTVKTDKMANFAYWSHPDPAWPGNALKMALNNFFQLIPKDFEILNLGIVPSAELGGGEHKIG